MPRAPSRVTRNERAENRQCVVVPERLVADIEALVAKLHKLADLQLAATASERALSGEQIVRLVATVINLTHGKTFDEPFRDEAGIRLWNAAFNCPSLLRPEALQKGEGDA